jgi:hypothetical protein
MRRIRQRLVLVRRLAGPCQYAKRPSRSAGVPQSPPDLLARPRGHENPTQVRSGRRVRLEIAFAHLPEVADIEDLKVIPPKGRRALDEGGTGPAMIVWR